MRARPGRVAGSEALPTAAGREVGLCLQQHGPPARVLHIQATRKPPSLASNLHANKLYEVLSLRPVAALSCCMCFACARRMMSPLLASSSLRVRSARFHLGTCAPRHAAALCLLTRSELSPRPRVRPCGVCVLLLHALHLRSTSLVSAAPPAWLGVCLPQRVTRASCLERRWPLLARPDMNWFSFDHPPTPAHDRQVARHGRCTATYRECGSGEGAYGPVFPGG